MARTTALTSWTNEVSHLARLQRSTQAIAPLPPGKASTLTASPAFWQRSVRSLTGCLGTVLGFGRGCSRGSNTCSGMLELSEVQVD